MADCRSIHARAALAPVPTLTLDDLEGRSDCCQSGHSARIRALSAAHAGCQSVINSLCTKTVTNHLMLNSILWKSRRV
jgi:hypothetical protein